MSVALRAFQANGVEYEEAMRWMGLDRRRPLGDSDVATLAWALHVAAEDMRRRMTLLEWRAGGRWTQLAGQRLCRWIAPTSMLAKVCPACLRENGFAKIVWLTRATPACHLHGYSLIRECGSCGRPIRWSRPGLRICQCGRFFKIGERVAQPEAELIAWLAWAEAVMQGDVDVAQGAMQQLPPMLQDLSVDGAFRLVEAFGLLEHHADPVRNLRHSSVPLVAVGGLLSRGLLRLLKVGDGRQLEPGTFDLVHLPALADLADDPATETDGQRAAWLLDVHRAMNASGSGRVGSRPRRQIPLFL